MAPTMIFRNPQQPLVAYGSPGGAAIIKIVINATVNLIDLFWQSVSMKGSAGCGQIEAKGDKVE
jgi:hypothetical protein